jgi:hypothetical protein
MQVRMGNPSTASTESPPEDIIVLVDSAEVASEYSMRSARGAGRPRGGVCVASRCVETLVAGSFARVHATVRRARRHLALGGPSA